MCVRAAVCRLSCPRASIPTRVCGCESAVHAASGSACAVDARKIHNSFFPPPLSSPADPAALPPPPHKTAAPAPGGPRPNPPSTTAAAAAAADEDDDPHLLRTRTYDLMMTYDKFYQTPRLWLAGYSPDRAPLGCAAVLGDVAAEHARKTVTWDPFPHGPGRAASIHPCRHAAVMKKLASVTAGGGSGSGGGGGGASVAAAALPVDRYLVLFLKFIQAVIPTIEYDFTMAAATAARA